jgi:hypothetical protein
MVKISGTSAGDDYVFQGAGLAVHFAKWHTSEGEDIPELMGSIVVVDYCGRCYVRGQRVGVYAVTRGNTAGRDDLRNCGAMFCTGNRSEDQPDVVHHDCPGLREGTAS